MQDKTKKTLSILGILIIALLIIAVIILDASPVGQIYLPPYRQEDPKATGVYIGNDVVLTVWHVVMFGDEQDTIGFRRPLQIINQSILDVDVMFGHSVYKEQEIELGVIKLEPSRLNWIGLSTPCLSTQPTNQGDIVKIISYPGFRYPSESATLVIHDPVPQMRQDSLSPQHSAMTIIATISSDAADRVQAGSSGGPVFNESGEIIGLVWDVADRTEEDWADGEGDVLITPVSAWLPFLETAVEENEELQYVLDAVCDS